MQLKVSVEELVDEGLLEFLADMRGVTVKVLSRSSEQLTLSKREVELLGVMPKGPMKKPQKKFDFFHFSFQKYFTFERKRFILRI